jgi:hypothetical protein
MQPNRLVRSFCNPRKSRPFETPVRHFRVHVAGRLTRGPGETAAKQLGSRPSPQDLVKWAPPPFGSCLPQS